MRWRRAIEWTGFGVGSAFVAILGLCAAVILAVGDPYPPTLSNRSDRVTPATLGEPTYRFAVLGDTQKGTTGLRRMLVRLREEDPAFYVHTGDLVGENDVGHHRLAAWTIARAKIDVPMVVVPGNHDIKRNTYLFEQRIGPLELTFVRRPLWFITVDNAMGLPPATAALEKRLKQAEKEDGAIVLFMHTPPWDVKSETFAPRPGYEDVLRLIRQYRVRYVFSGHVHTYRRVEHDGTVWIANGVGGDYEHWSLSTKVYATVVDVNGRDIADRRIELEPSHSLWDNIEHLALGHVAQAYRSEPIWTWAATVAILGAWIWLIVRLWRKPKPAAV